MYFAITIDTEEDQWSDYSRGGSTLRNITELPELQSLFNGFAAKPTYLTTYQVAKDRASVNILKTISSDGRGEIGAHCHPWNTPPFEEELCVDNSMLCNLDSSLQNRKLIALTTMIEERFGERPKSFRAGRWGYSSEVARQLTTLGYETDTSLTPFVDWSEYQGPDLSMAPQQPFYSSPENLFESSTAGRLLEVPVSIGFSREPFSFWNAYYKMANRSRITKKIFWGALSRAGFLSKVWLSPELSTSEEMIRLITLLRRKKCAVLNLMFHSNSLTPGNTPFVRSRSERQQLLERVAAVLDYVSREGIEYVTLSDLKNKVVTPL